MDAFGAHSIVFYLHDFSLLYRVFDKDESVIEEGSFEVPLRNILKDGLEERNYGEILPWYQNTFLTFGYWIIDQSFGAGNNYFYINKLIISPTDEQNK